MIAQCLCGNRSTGSRAHVGRKEFITGRVSSDGYHRLAHLWQGTDHTLDFTSFDTESTDLHLGISPAKELDRSIRQPAADVTTRIKLRTRICGEWVAHKAFGSQLRTIVIASRKSSSTNKQLAPNTCRNRVHPRVQNVDLRVRNGATDRYRGELQIIRGNRVAGSKSGALGWPVTVH